VCRNRDSIHEQSMGHGEQERSYWQEPTFSLFQTSISVNQSASPSAGWKCHSGTTLGQRGASSQRSKDSCASVFSSPSAFASSEWEEGVVGHAAEEGEAGGEVVGALESREVERGAPAAAAVREAPSGPCRRLRTDLSELSSSWLAVELELLAGGGDTDPEAISTERRRAGEPRFWTTECWNGPCRLPDARLGVTARADAFAEGTCAPVACDRGVDCRAVYVGGASWCCATVSVYEGGGLDERRIRRTSTLREK
jgi:hypothetical protein